MQFQPPLWRYAQRWAGAAAFWVLTATYAAAQTPAPTAPDVSTPAVIAASSATPSPGVTPAEHGQVLYPASGVQSSSPSITRGHNEPPNLPGLATSFLMLLALCGAGYYLLRRQSGFAAGSKGPRKLVVSESRSLGNRQFLVVVEYENERILIGVTPGKIDYLCPLPMAVHSPETAFKA